MTMAIDDVNDDDDGDYDDDQNLLVSSLWYLARVAQEKELVTVETTLGPGTNEKSGFLTKQAQKLVQVDALDLSVLYFVMLCNTL